MQVNFPSATVGAEDRASEPAFSLFCIFCGSYIGHVDIGRPQRWAVELMTDDDDDDPGGGSVNC